MRYERTSQLSNLICMNFFYLFPSRVEKFYSMKKIENEMKISWNYNHQNYYNENLKFPSFYFCAELELFIFRSKWTINENKTNTI